jgi:hypothetical protein
MPETSRTSLGGDLRSQRWTSKIRIALLLTLPLSFAGVERAHAQVVPQWPADFTYVGKTVLASAPYPRDRFGLPTGDFRFGKGLAIHREANGTFSIYVGSWNPQVVLKWTTTPVNGVFSGNAGFVRAMGSMPYQGELIGLYMDRTGALVGSFNSTYDADWSIAVTLSRASISPVTSRLVSKGSFRFANRSDKMTMGGVTAVPAWWRTRYGQTCNALAGWGGYWSAIERGPVSMGPAATCFTLPTDADNLNAGYTSPKAVANRPVLGFPFSSSKTIHTAATKRINMNYWQTYGWGWWPSKVTTSPGWWNPGDSVYQGCTWVDNTAVSGLMCFPMLQEGCNWYGSTATPPLSPPCNATAGKAAALNSKKQSPWVFIYDPDDLGEVANGQRSQSSVQPVSQVPLRLPGVTVPFPGLPDTNHIITGVTYDAASNLLAIVLRNTSTISTRPAIYWYRVVK